MKAVSLSLLAAPYRSLSLRQRPWPQSQWVLSSLVGLLFMSAPAALAQSTREPLPDLSAPPTDNPGTETLVVPAPEPFPASPPADQSDQDSGSNSPRSTSTLPPQTVPSIELLRPQPELSTPADGSLDPVNANFDQYRLGPGDSLFVSVQRFPDLSFQATLDIDGKIIVPIQGAVPFEGLALNEAEFLLRRIYNQYVVIRELNPQYQGPPDVTVALTAQRGVEITILGEVARPGFYPLPVARVSTALLAAGGASSTADLRALEVQRRLRDGSIVSETVDLFTPLRDGRALPDLRLENGDVLLIPRLDPSRLGDYDVNLVSRSTLAQAEITIRFINFSTGDGRGAASLNATTVPNGSTLTDVITSIGVNPDRAKLNSVALVRYDPESGRAVPVVLDAYQAFYGDPTQDPPLRDNDVIIVGRNFFSRLTYALTTITQPFRDILSFLLFFEGLFSNNLFN